MSLDALDYWRLADELSVIDAAILITGNNPEHHYYDDDNIKRQIRNYDGYDATYKALRNAILSNKLSATIKHSMRGTSYCEGFGDEPDEITKMQHEEQISYNMLITRRDSDNRYELLKGKTFLNFGIDDISYDHYFYICKEPNWAETIIGVDDLKDWLEGKGMYPRFFFPKKPAADIKDQTNPRYSAKLAACIAAWEKITKPAKNSSVKQTIKDWLKSNAAGFGVGDQNGIVSDKVAESLAVVVNWNLRGGATPTPNPEEDFDEKEDEPVQNYQHGYVDDSEIPF